MTNEKTPFDLDDNELLPEDDWNYHFHDNASSRMKVYNDFNLLQVANKAIFATSHEYHKRMYDVPAAGYGADHDAALAESRRRAKTSVRDIAFCNHFDCMFTWTLDGSLINRYDSKEVSKKVRNFLSNASQRHGFQYVLVPELHEDGAIHFHGLCNLGDLKCSPAEHNGRPVYSDYGRQVYNMVTWKWGFSTLVYIDDNYDKAVNYICKYITKSSDKVFGKWYLSSRNLKKKPDILIIRDIEYEDFRDEQKIENGIQYEVDVFSNVKIINERQDSFSWVDRLFDLY